MPIITGDAEAASVRIHSGGQLTVAQKGALTIDGEDLFTEGIQLYGGHIMNYGTVSLDNLDHELSAEVMGQLTKQGILCQMDNPYTQNNQETLAR